MPTLSVCLRVPAAVSCGTTIHENTLMDVGSAMSKVALEKYTLVSTSSPTVNMWCAHTK